MSSDSTDTDDTVSTGDGEMLRDMIKNRDRHRCTNCRGAIESVVTFDVDHNTPRGVGGSDRPSNLSTLCRRCHDAKHGDGLAPTVQLESTGRMTKIEFDWFQHFMNEIFPALCRQVGVRLKPRFAIDGYDAWYCPLGDLRALDKRLSERDEKYDSLRAADYM